LFLRPRRKSAKSKRGQRRLRLTPEKPSAEKLPSDLLRAKERSRVNEESNNLNWHKGLTYQHSSH
jgi:hypothetical protein